MQRRCGQKLPLGGEFLTDAHRSCDALIPFIGSPSVFRAVDEEHIFHDCSVPELEGKSNFPIASEKITGCLNPIATHMTTPMMIGKNQLVAIEFRLQSLVE